MSALSFLAALLITQSNPNQVLKDMDAAMNAYDDLQLTYEMTDAQPGRGPRKIGMKIAIRGDMRVTEFTAPADMKGTKILVKTQTQMYVYVPAYKKVRRIASHVTNQGFMGTTYSSDDLALNRFADKYTPKILGEDEATWSMELTKKNDEAPYPKVMVTVDKKLHQPVKLQFFNEDGKHIKTETRKNWDCDGKICAPGELSMTDHRSDGHTSTMVRKTWKANSGLPDRMFTKRYLQKGG